MAAGLSVEPWWRPGDGRLRVIFLDVGQGDATFIELPEGRRLLVDGGPGGARRFDVGERVIAPFLWNRRRATARRGRALSLGRGSRGRARGRPPSLHGGRVLGKRIVATGRRGDAAARSSARARRGACSAPASDSGSGEALITVLNPDGGRAGRRQRRVPGAAAGLARRLAAPHGRPGMARARSACGSGPGPLRVTMLKVAHHGSRFSSTAPFLDAARPAARRRLRGRAQPLPPSGAGGARPARGGRRARLPHRPRRRRHRRNRRRPTLGDALGERSHGGLRSATPSLTDRNLSAGSRTRHTTASSVAAGGRGGTRGEREG